MARFARMLGRAALLVLASLAAPPPAGADVVFHSVRQPHVLVAPDGGAPTVVARDGVLPAASSDGATIVYSRPVGVRGEGTVGLLRAGLPPATVTVLRRGVRRALRDVNDHVLSPDGARLAYAAVPGGWNVTDLSTGVVRPVTAEYEFPPRFSADGRMLAWTETTGRGAYVRPTDRAAKPRRIFASSASDVAWVGGRVAVLHGDLRRQRLTLVDPVSGARTRTPLAPIEAIDIGAVHGDRLLALVDIGEDRTPKRIVVVDIDGRVIRTIRAGRRFLGEDPAFSSDGRQLYVVENTTLLAVDLATGGRRVVARGVGDDIAAFTPPPTGR